MLRLALKIRSKHKTLVTRLKAQNKHRVQVIKLARVKKMFGKKKLIQRRFQKQPMKMVKANPKLALSKLSL